MAEKYVYMFTPDRTDGRAEDKNLLGGKGANLAEMASLGLPVPPGFTITTEVCTYYYDHKRTFPQDLGRQIDAAVADIERIMGRKFGDTAKQPLLFSVRSGARASMPGMMDTILNLGINDLTVAALAKASGNERFAYDSYRRFLQMYSNVVLEADMEQFEHALDDLKLRRKAKLDTDLTAADLKELVETYREIGRRIKKVVPQDPREQLEGAIGAVFQSWMNKRAIVYRRLNNIPADWGTAVNVQAMVFGNMGAKSATGVCFSRDPATGENQFFGEYLVNAQGEDVVAGIRTPGPMSKLVKKRNSFDGLCLEEEMPELYKQLVGIRDKLEAHYRDMQDMEFTIEEGRLWMLQTRNGKRTIAAALQIAVDMVNEKMLTRDEAVCRIDAAQLDQLLHPTLDPKAVKEAKVLTTGLPASPGAAVGKVVFSAEDAEEWVNRGEKVVLVRLETSPEDITGMTVSEGILTARGGMTSHAAVVARGMGTPCVSGAGGLDINYAKRQFKADGITVKEGDTITLDGGTGKVMLGAIPTRAAQVSGYFATLMEWVDAARKLGVRTNADTPRDAQVAREFGAEGIGLCRTEHMFFDQQRIKHMRQMILSDGSAARERALDKLLPYQRDDFVGIFKAMKGLPVTIRLLDPPLHEFLPQNEHDITEIAAEMELTREQLMTKIAQLHEFNPMLGHRGVRLMVTFPEIAAMQARAICEAAATVAKELGAENVKPEIMIPIVGSRKEFDMIAEIVRDIADEVFKGGKVKYKVGTMIELPRACLVADQIAEGAEFFSFGTNDLTQTTLGMSRDDAGAFLGEYAEKGIYKRDPFATIDQEGVGQMMQIGIEKGRRTRPDIKLGICGEHGGDPDSVKFCHKLGLTYVSCSPYRVPIARLAAAQAAIEEKKAKSAK
ncbi:pyruvate, phosphate dikinase [Alphaproteobacteria bacterium]|nr:pyruvate, phosphate dikinase [Alphaproteobacteria bacterium]